MIGAVLLNQIVSTFYPLIREYVHGISSPQPNDETEDDLTLFRAMGAQRA